MNNSSPPSPKPQILLPKCSSFLFLPILLTPLLLLQYPNPSLPLSLLRRRSLAFLPLKDIRANSSFISSVPDSPGEPSFILFPSPSSGHRLLCLSAADPIDGSRNSYALASPQTLPLNSTFLPNLTFVSETFYDHTNPWHGLAAILPFANWHAQNGCRAPQRWLLFHWGEVRRGMGTWVRALAEASTGGEVRVLGDQGEENRVVCLEKAVVARRNDEGMSGARKKEVYDLMRCRAREYCGLEKKGGNSLGEIRMTLLFRVGSRSFRNETAVAGVFERECAKVEGCRVRILRSAADWAFCDQVKAMSETDILVSPHGAQMTNMIFMDENSSVMEFFPKGWLELAGAGQYVFRWLADSAGMKHQGQWRDPNGEICPFEDKDQCFTFYKDGAIGHDEAFFSQWAAKVLEEAKVQKLKEAALALKRSNTQSRDATDFNACCSCG